MTALAMGGAAMTEPRRRSLLSFAIAASLAVLPVMLGMVLLVAVLRPADEAALPSKAATVSERYISVRHLAALKTFEQAIVRREGRATASPSGAEVLAALPSCRSEWDAKWRATGPSQAERIAAQLASLDAALLRFSSRSNARVDAPVGLDLPRWFDEARGALSRTVEAPEYPGRRFQVSCGDLAAALAALSRGDARMLDVLAWRGTESARVLARWQPGQVMEIAPHQVARRNPWNGVAGCIYLGAHDAGAAPSHFVGGRAAQRVCVLPSMSGAHTSANALSATHAASAPRATTTLAALPGEPSPELEPNDPRWMVPPSLLALLQPLDTLRQPAGTLYRELTDMPVDGVATATHHANRVVLDGTPVDAGFSIDLTIDPAMQALAQKTAACYTGRQDLCRALDIQRAEDKGQPIGHRLLEGAMVRMAAVAVIDVKSGRIEALAGALSPCTRQEYDGPGRDPRCDTRLPYPVQYRPDALLNPAVFHDAMPASTIKPIMAAAFLADHDVGPPWLAAERRTMKPGAVPAMDSLRGQLMRSDSARFLDRMFCGDKNFADCGRPWRVQAMAQDFGWNADCAQARLDCGKRDLLFGGAFGGAFGGPFGDTSTTGTPAEARPPVSLPVAFGRLMSGPAGGKLSAPMQLAPRIALSPAIVSRCAAGADGRRRSDDDWEKCRGGSVVDVVAEGWGQGHARSSALGVAGMMGALAAAANGQQELTRPHLVDAVRGVGQDAARDAAVLRWSTPRHEPNPISRDAAEVILDGLTYSHRNGTARTACEQVFDAKACKSIDWLAGKTGTPSFPSDGVSLDEIARRCRVDAAVRAKDPACSSLRPYKWYVAAFRSDTAGGPWTHAIAVLTERNWTRDGGQVHGAGDHGPNPSAEIAMQIVGRRMGVIATATAGTPGATP
jgi:hypothetical protein